MHRSNLREAQRSPNVLKRCINRERDRVGLGREQVPKDLITDVNVLRRRMVCAGGVGGKHLVCEDAAGWEGVVWVGLGMEMETVWKILGIWGDYENYWYRK